MDIEATITESFEKCLDKARKIYPEIFKRRIKLRFKDTDTFVGMAVYASNTVLINPYYANINLKFVSKMIVPHEIAHLVQNMVYPNARYDHGPEWQAICLKLGGDAKRLVSGHHFGYYK